MKVCHKPIKYTQHAVEKGKHDSLHYVHSQGHADVYSPRERSRDKISIL